MVSFSQLQAVPKKNNIFGEARKKFGPSYFVTALVPIVHKEWTKESIYFHFSSFFGDFCLKVAERNINLTRLT